MIMIKSLTKTPHVTSKLFYNNHLFLLEMFDLELAPGTSFNFFIIFYKMLKNEEISKSILRKASDLYRLQPFYFENLIYNKNTNSFSKHRLKM